MRQFVFLLCVCFFAGPKGLAQDESQTGVSFRFVPGGRFIQGTSGGERVLQNAFPLSTTGQNYGNAEEPAHVTWVTKPFFIAETEITVGQFREFVQATGYQTTAERGKTEMVGWDPTPEDKPLYQSYDFARDAKFNWANPGFQQADNHPVVGVSYTDAKAYCQWLSQRDGHRYRLPTEAEWELACRAGTTTWFSFGDVAKGVVHQHGNFGNVELEKHRQHAAERQWLLDWDKDPQDGFVFTAPVGSFARNPWGIADMHGNVWEWCEDLWLDTVYKDYVRPRYDQPCGVAVDPVNLDRPQTTTNDFHTIRGGSWYNGDLQCRSSSRTSWDANDAACYVGFRIVREADSDSSTAARDAYEAEQDAIKAIEAAGGRLYSSGGIDLEVRFEGDTVSDSVLASLASLPDLQRIRLGYRDRDRSLSQSGLEHLASLSDLKLLEFRGGVDVEALDLSVLSRLHSLEVLRFSRDSPLRDSHLESLSGLQSLIEFQCFGTTGGLSDDGIAHLSSNRSLQTLLVWENQASGEYLQRFEGCPLQQLASTAAYGSDGAMTDAGAGHLASFPELQSLTLDGQKQIGSATMKVIANLHRLTELSLRDCSGFLGDDFVDLAKLQRLRRVNLTGSRAGDVAAAAIGSIPRIEAVQIGNQAQDATPLTDRGIQELAGAFSIRDLDLISNLMTDQGLKHLGRINRLTQLTITSPQVTGSGLGPLVDLPELRDLSLRTSGLTDVAFDYLSRAKSVTKLRLAHRGFRPPAALTDEGVMKMAAATGLRELWLPRNDTGMTEATMDKLKTMMPKTSVIPYTVTWDQ